MILSSDSFLNFRVIALMPGQPACWIGLHCLDAVAEWKVKKQACVSNARILACV